MPPKETAEAWVKRRSDVFIARHAPLINEPSPSGSGASVSGRLLLRAPDQILGYFRIRKR